MAQKRSRAAGLAARASSRSAGTERAIVRRANARRRQMDTEKPVLVGLHLVDRGPAPLVDRAAPLFDARVGSFVGRRLPRLERVPVVAGRAGLGKLLLQL